MLEKLPQLNTIQNTVAQFFNQIKRVFTVNCGFNRLVPYSLEVVGKAGYLSTSEVWLESRGWEFLPCSSSSDCTEDTWRCKEACGDERAKNEWEESAHLNTSAHHNEMGQGAFPPHTLFYWTAEGEQQRVIR